MRRAGPLPYLLIAPAVVFLGVLFVVPLVQTLALAFQADGGWSFGPAEDGSFQLARPATGAEAIAAVRKLEDLANAPAR